MSQGTQVAPFAAHAAVVGATQHDALVVRVIEHNNERCVVVKESDFDAIFEQRLRFLADNNDLRRRNQELQDRLNTEVPSLKRELADARTEATCQRADLGRQCARIEDIEADNVRLKRENEELRKENQELKEKVAILEREVREQKADLRTAMDMMNEMKRDLEAIKARNLVTALCHCVKLLGYHYEKTVNKKGDDAKLGCAIWIHTLYKQSINPESPVHEDAKKKFAEFTAEEPFKCFRDADVIAVVETVYRNRCGESHSNEALLSLLDHDRETCYRLLKSQLSGHSEAAIMKIIQAVVDLRSSVMAATPDWA